MCKKMHKRLTIVCLMQFSIILSVEGVSLILNPQSMVVGSSTASPVMRLEIICSSSGSPDLDSIVQLKISRRKSMEVSFTVIASVRFDAPAKLDPAIPQDIQSKSPNVTGSIDFLSKSGILTVSMNGQGLKCSDQAEFQCFMNYLDNLDVSHLVEDNKNFTVSTAPIDILMDSAEYYDDKGNTLQLVNNSVLNAGNRIKYRCTASIGSLPEGEIIWERSSELGPFNTFAPYIPTVITDIVQEASRQDGCFYRRTSTMYYNLTKFDEDGITFRCKARTYLGGQLYEALSNQQFRTVTASTSSSSRVLDTTSTTTASTSSSSRVLDTTSTTTGSNVNSSTVLAAVLGVVMAVFVILVIVLSIYLHRYRKLAEELQSQLQSRSNTYDGLKGTVATSEPYAVLNVESTENHKQSDYLNPYDRLNRTVGRSEPYDMLESSHSDGNVRQGKKPYVNMAHNVL